MHRPPLCLLAALWLSSPCPILPAQDPSPTPQESILQEPAAAAIQARITALEADAPVDTELQTRVRVERPR